MVDVEVSTGSTLTTVATPSETSLTEAIHVEDALREEEDLDMQKTLALLATAALKMEQEEAMTRLEEEDMQRSMELLASALHEDTVNRLEEEDMKRTLELLSEALSETEIRLLRGELGLSERFVHFSANVEVRFLSEEEHKEAREARRSDWEAGPTHDELWDGDTGTFRENELSPEELAMILRRRTTVAARLRKLFSARVKNIDARSHANLLVDADSDEDDVSGEVMDFTSALAQGPPMPLRQNKIEKRRSLARLIGLVTRRRSKEPILDGTA